MSSKPQKRMPLTLMEYLFLFPGILSLSPLFAALRITKTAQDQSELVFLFRLLCLAYLLMFSAFILYHWRPSIRLRYSFVHNMTVVTCLGMFSVFPIVAASLVVKSAQIDNLTLFTSLEFYLASMVMFFCAAINLACVIYTFKRRALRPWFGRWAFLSVFALCTMLIMLIRFA